MTHEDAAKALIDNLWHRSRPDGQKYKTVEQWKTECLPVVIAAFKRVEAESQPKGQTS